MNRAPWMSLLTAFALGCGSAPVDNEADNTSELSSTGGESEGATQVEVIREAAGAEPSVGARAVAEMAPTEGNTVTGTVVFVQGSNGLSVSVELSGLEAGTSHGFHVHETGDCSAPDGTSAGGHYDPEGHEHALPDASVRHAGDMGNVTADDEGKVQTRLTFDNISIGGANPIEGLAVIVHANPDDGGQPTGNAGARVACGVIAMNTGADGVSANEASAESTGSATTTSTPSPAAPRRSRAVSAEEDELSP